VLPSKATVRRSPAFEPKLRAERLEFIGTVVPVNMELLGTQAQPE
jgi:hypothetical protein